MFLEKQDDAITTTVLQPNHNFVIGPTTENERANHRMCHRSDHNTVIGMFLILSLRIIRCL